MKCVRVRNPDEKAAANILALLLLRYFIAMVHAAAHLRPYRSAAENRLFDDPMAG